MIHSVGMNRYLLMLSVVVLMVAGQSGCSASLPQDARKDEPCHLVKQWINNSVPNDEKPVFEEHYQRCISGQEAWSEFPWIDNMLADEELSNIGLSFVQMLRELLDAGAKRPDVAPLHMAAAAGDADECRRLIAAGIKPDTPLDPEGERNVDPPIVLGPNDPAYTYSLTPLAFAVGAQQVETTRVLLEAGADVNHMFGELDTALHYAARVGNDELCRILLDAGADVHATTMGIGVDALYCALQSGNEKVVKTLISHGANVNAMYGMGYRWTALKEAADTDDAAIVRMLLKAGANPHTKDGNNLTPAEYARKHGLRNAARALED